MPARLITLSERPNRGEHKEGAHHADRDRHCCHHGRSHAPEEEQQHTDREQAANHNVAADEPERGVDIVGLVVDLGEGKPHFAEHPEVDVAGDLAEFGHRLEDVGVLVAGDTDGDVASTEAADDAVGLAGSQLGAGHVADIHRPAFAAIDDHGLHLLGRAKLAERPHDIPPLSFPEITARGVFVLAGKRSAKVVDRQLAGGKLLRVDDHLKLIVSAANQVGARHSLDPLQPALDPRLPPSAASTRCRSVAAAGERARDAP
jgi:hypothetical protein